MTEKYQEENYQFDSEFHRRYVGGEGVVRESGFVSLEKTRFESMSVDDILKMYRDYMHNPKAEFPEALKEELRLQGKAV